MKKFFKNILVFYIGLLITGITFFIYIKYFFVGILLQNDRENVLNKIMSEVTDAISIDGEIIALCRDGTVWKWDYISGMEGAVRVSGLDGIPRI